jgi:hypothetical protein
MAHLRVRAGMANLFWHQIGNQLKAFNRSASESYHRPSRARAQSAYVWADGARHRNRTTETQNKKSMTMTGVSTSNPKYI